MTFGLTPDGFNKMRLADIKQATDNEMIAQFGEINISPQSVFGQQIGVWSKGLADAWENLEDIYYSQYPGTADGVALDNVVALNGISRLPARQTSVIAVLAGNEATAIPAGSLAKIPNTNNVFSNPNAGVITRDSAYSVTVTVGTLAAQAYTIIINNLVYFYSLPIITFTGSFVSGNSVLVTLNGVQLASVPFNTDNDTTLADVAAVIEGDSSVLTATPSGGDTITIVPAVGFSVTINSIENDGTGIFPTYAITFGVPGSVGAVSSNLTAILNEADLNFTAADLTGSFTVTSTSVEIPFAISAQSNLSITAQSSPIVFLSQDYGPIPAPANTLTEILTPIAGWETINNPEAGLTGRFIETDSELRIRRAQSIRLAGNATVEAIRAHLLQNVEGVTSALVFENVDVIQQPINIIFSENLVSGNVITITMNARTLAPITFATSSLLTMGQLALLLAAQPEIASASVTGATNNTLTITMNVFQEVTIDNVDISMGATQANYVVKGGRPPKSFEAVVQGGSDADVAEEIWLSKPAGIQTYGNTDFTITDSQGDPQVIFFSRPTPIYIWANVVLTLYSEENFPANGLALVQQAIFAYGESLGVGVDVLRQRVMCQIFTVPGVASGVVTLAATNSVGDAPAFAAADIPIGETEISVWDLNRINVTL